MCVCVCVCVCVFSLSEIPFVCMCAFILVYGHFTNVNVDLWLCVAMTQHQTQNLEAHLQKMHISFH